MMPLITFRDLKMVVRLVFGSYGFTYPLLRYSRLKRGFAPNKVKMVNSETDICIDGFPHSGNTFFTRLVNYWNPDLNIARHMHVPFQIIRSINANIPTLVLIREPTKALASILYKYSDLHPYTASFYYYVFYKRIFPLREKFLIVDFGRLIQDPSFFLEKANRKFQCSIKCENYNKEIEENIMRKVPKKIEKVKSLSAMQKRHEIEDDLRKMEIYKKSLLVYEKYRETFA